MKTEIRHPDKQAETGSYSAAIEMDGWLFVSGHAAEDLRTGAVLDGDTAEQTRTTLSNIGRLLEAAGSDFAHVVKCTCYLSDIGDFAVFDAAYRAFFPRPLPARTTVQAGLPPGLKIEIDVIARIPKPR